MHRCGSLCQRDHNHGQFVRRNLVLRHHDTKESNRSRACPKDKTGKPKPFQEWNLNSLIDVAHDCGWIQLDVKNFSHVLRDYRNMVHPWHQRATGIVPDRDTAAICWQVVQAAVNDLVSSLKKNLP
jgi:hypothetical protein